MSSSNGIIRFDGYRLLKLQYDCAASFTPIEGKNGNYHFSIADGYQELGNATIQINLMVRVFFDENEDYDNAPLKGIIELAGMFVMKDKDEWDHQYDSNAIAILYPYTRAIWSSVTSQSGREPVILPTINTKALLLQREELQNKSESYDNSGDK